MDEQVPAPTSSNSDYTRAETLVSRLGEKLAVSAHVRTVYGEPITSHGRTLIPVAKVGYGFAAGSGGRAGEQIGGGGGGGGVGSMPTGYIEITDAGTRYVAISSHKKLLTAVLLSGLAGYLLGRISR